MQNENLLKKILQKHSIEIADDEAKDIEGLFAYPFGIYLGKIADKVINDREFKLISEQIDKKGISNDGYRYIIDKILMRKLKKSVDSIYEDFLNLIIDNMLKDANKVKDIHTKTTKLFDKSDVEFEREVLDIIEQQGEEMISSLGIDNER